MIATNRSHTATTVSNSKAGALGRTLLLASVASFLVLGCTDSDKASDGNDSLAGGESTASEMTSAATSSGVMVGAATNDSAPTNQVPSNSAATSTTGAVASSATSDPIPVPSSAPTEVDADDTSTAGGVPGTDEGPATDGDGTDEPSSEPTEDTGESTDTGSEPTNTETSDETSDAPEPPRVGECSPVITGQLSECAETSDADPNFSFFVASRSSMVALSGNPLGFGGNLGGLECADTICALIAECVAPGNAKTWHAFLSTSEVDAKDRIGTGPWHDVIGTKIADDLNGLIGVERPTTADGVVNRNLPNEFGCESLTPACDDVKEDNHHVMTGSDENGAYVEDRTCNDWTSDDGTPGTGPAVGLSWERSLLFGDGSGGGPGGGAVHWLFFENESGCAPGGNLNNDPPQGNNDGTVGSGGGYGAIYCFAVVEQTGSGDRVE